MTNAKTAGKHFHPQNTSSGDGFRKSTASGLIVLRPKLFPVVAFSSSHIVYGVPCPNTLQLSIRTWATLVGSPYFCVFWFSGFLVPYFGNVSQESHFRSVVLMSSSFHVRNKKRIPAFVFLVAWSLITLLLRRQPGPSLGNVTVRDAVIILLGRHWKAQHLKV